MFVFVSAMSTFMNTSTLSFYSAETLTILIVLQRLCFSTLFLSNFRQTLLLTYCMQSFLQFSENSVILEQYLFYFVLLIYFKWKNGKRETQMKKNWNKFIIVNQNGSIDHGRAPWQGQSRWTKKIQVYFSHFETDFTLDLPFIFVWKVTLTITSTEEAWVKAYFYEEKLKT